MKLSLSWLLEHIQGGLRDRALTLELATEVAAKLSAHVAEIEQCEEVRFPLEQLVCAVVSTIEGDKVRLKLIDAPGTVTIASRKDALVGSYFLLYKEEGQYRWATLEDFSSIKDGLLPALAFDEVSAKKWKKTISSRDYIFTIDNKAITHRPDLWGHRGFARELALLFDWNLESEEAVAPALPIKHYTHKAGPQEDMPYTIAIETPRCNRLAALYFNELVAQPSVLWMALRLALVDCRPMQALVDCTNYVMLDSGQPMHAFDGSCLTGNTLIVRNGKKNEKVELLDGGTIEVTSLDAVLADADHVVGLAGIMGGRACSISSATTNVLIEAAHFDATSIRLSAAYHKRRTDASTRFEKSLDPQNNTFALLRYVKLLQDLEIPYKTSGVVISVGAITQDKTIILSHQFLTERLGISLPSRDVVNYFKKLGFGVTLHDDRQHTVYTVVVPSSRSTKDIICKEDLIEEVARLYGYAAIPHTVPSRVMKPFETRLVDNMRALKRQCAFGLQMHEVSNYALYDEEFLKSIRYTPQQPVELANPVSEQWQRLVTSLIPHLLKNVQQNIHQVNDLRFFEVNRVWRKNATGIVEEKLVCSFIHFTYQKAADFYYGKRMLHSLLSEFGLLVAWKKASSTLEQFYFTPQTAELLIDNKLIGYAGIVNPAAMKLVADGGAFCAEFEIDDLLNYTAPLVHYRAASKYQQVSFDMSVLVPFSITVDQLQDALARTDGRIIDVQLQDFFEKPEWKETRSMTFRVTVSDRDKTLTKDEIDSIWNDAVISMKHYGAEIR